MNTKSKKIDMCSGSLFKNILLFSVPLMLSSMLQLLYNAADVIVVGRFAGEQALAGVGTSGSIMSLSLNFFVGISGGVTVAMGRAVGEKNNTKTHRVVHTAISLSLIAGLILTLFGAYFAKNLLGLMDVPEDVLPQAIIYTRIMFFGTVPSMVYNFGSGLLRALGDTKRPLYIVSVSGVINVVLNLIFVLCFKMQADGVALATIISQTFSAIMIVILLLRQNDSSRLIISKLRIYKEQLLLILRIGIPSGMQGIVFSLSNVIIQSSINSFGSATIAGSAAAANIGTFIYMALNTFSQSSMAFVSQNIGAKKYDRIDKIVRYCAAYVLIFGTATMLITIFFGKLLLKIYLPDNPEALKYGYVYMSIILTTYSLCGLMEVLTGALRGLGASFLSMIASIVGICGIRIGWIFTAFKAYHTLEMLYISYPISWLATTVFLYTVYKISLRKYKKADA